MRDCYPQCMCFLSGFIRPQPKKWRGGGYRFGAPVRPSVCLSVRLSVRYTFFVQTRTSERKVVQIRKCERSGSVDVPFDHSDRNTRPEVVKLAKIAKNCVFSRLELVWASIYGSDLEFPTQ